MKKITSQQYKLGGNTAEKQTSSCQFSLFAVISNKSVLILIMNESVKNKLNDLLEVYFENLKNLQMKLSKARNISKNKN